MMQNNLVPDPKEPIDVDRRVGLLLKARRLEVGLSQTEVANSLGITFQQVQKYESGCNRISVGRLWTVSNLLKVGISYFFQAENAIFHNEGAFLQELLCNDDAVSLVKDFLNIKTPKHRRIICEMAKTLCEN